MLFGSAMGGPLRASEVRIQIVQEVVLLLPVGSIHCMTVKPPRVFESY